MLCGSFLHMLLPGEHQRFAPPKKEHNWLGQGSASLDNGPRELLPAVPRMAQRSFLLHGQEGIQQKNSVFSPGRQVAVLRHLVIRDSQVLLEDFENVPQ